MPYGWRLRFQTAAEASGVSWKAVLGRTSHGSRKQTTWKKSASTSPAMSAAPPQKGHGASRTASAPTMRGPSFLKTRGVWEPMGLRFVGDEGERHAQARAVATKTGHSPSGHRGDRTPRSRPHPRSAAVNRPAGLGERYKPRSGARRGGRRRGAACRPRAAASTEARSRSVPVRLGRGRGASAPPPR